MGDLKSPAVRRPGWSPGEGTIALGSTLMNQIKVTYSEVTKVERYLKDETVFMRVYFKSGSIHEMKNTLAVNKGDTLGVDSYGRIWWNFHGT